MKYFVIFNNDGETFVEILTENGLRSVLDEKEYGDDVEFMDVDESNVGDMVLFEANTNYWGGKILIVKGEAIVPKPKEIVKTWKV